MNQRGDSLLHSKKQMQQLTTPLVIFYDRIKVSGIRSIPHSPHSPSIINTSHCSTKHQQQQQ
jgi:hypothetical protein